MKINLPTFAAQVFAAFCGLSAVAFAAQASPPSPDAMATQPDPRDFVTRADTQLSALGNPMRFGGMNISWLGLRDDTGRLEDAHLPTEFEVKDAFDTVQAMGAGFIRSTSLAASAGCASCMAPTADHINTDALQHADHILRLAHDAGLKIVVPLAGNGVCPAAGPIDPTEGAACVFARAHNLPDGAFYTDPSVRADFARHVTMLLNHLNPETGLAWKDDPTILAWENCDACGAGVAAKTLADWTEFLGRTIKALDTRHLYENGAFAGRLGTGGDAADAALLALDTVDIVGDRVAPKPGSPPDLFTPAQQAVTAAGRIYVIDSYAWSPAHWQTLDDLEAFLKAIEKDRSVSGAFVNDLGAHADQGGWLPAAHPGVSTIYFPAAPTPEMDVATMEPRARAVRRLSYGMMDLVPIAFAPVDPPTIISVTHGKVVWRGSAGATKYSIARSADITQTGSWQTLCDRCVTDATPSWQDPAVPTAPTWYRVTPYNANLHAGLPSDPMESK